MKQPVYIKISTDLRSEWMQHELESFEAFKAVNHPLEYENHVYSLICSHFATDLVVRSETALVALVMSLVSSTLKKESPHNWDKIFDALERATARFNLSEEAKKMIGQYMEIKEPNKPLLFVRFLSGIEFEGQYFAADSVVEVVESHNDCYYVTGTQLCKNSFQQLPASDVTTFEINATKVGFQSRHYNHEEGWSMWDTTMDLRFEKNYRKNDFEVRSIFFVEE